MQSKPQTQIKVGAYPQNCHRFGHAKHDPLNSGICSNQGQMKTNTNDSMLITWKEMMRQILSCSDKKAGLDLTIEGRVATEHATCKKYTIWCYIDKLYITPNYRQIHKNAP